MGNSGYVYYYDIWSNLHFGYIAAAGGIPLHRVVAGAGYAQGVDTEGTAWEKATNIVSTITSPPNWKPDEEMKKFLFADDNKDRRAIITGYGLYDRQVTYQMLINIVTQFKEQWLSKS